jgi:hypothetical protein
MLLLRGRRLWRCFVTIDKFLGRQRQLRPSKKIQPRIPAEVLVSFEGTAHFIGAAPATFYWCSASNILLVQRQQHAIVGAPYRPILGMRRHECGIFHADSRVRDLSVVDFARGWAWSVSTERRDLSLDHPL